MTPTEHIQADLSKPDQKWMAGVFAVASAWLVWRCAPGPLWYDTAEFAATSWRLSLSHPPGHPLHALTTHGVQTFLPLGDLGFRANLTSSFCLALALAFFYRLLCFLGPQCPRLVVAAFALVPLCLPAIAEQGIRAEVYALQLLLSVWLCHLCLRISSGEDARALPLIALVFGLAGANHSYIAMGFVPLALVAMWYARVQARQVLAASIAGIFGLATYCYLPLRASAGLDVGWGQPDTMVSFWRTISGQDWSSNLIPDSSADGVLENLALVLGYMNHHLGIGVIVVGSLICLWAIPSWIKTRRWLVLAVAFAAALPFVLRLGNSFDPQNPDMGGYLATGFVALLVLSFMATSRLPGLFLPSVTTMLIGLATIQAVQRAPDGTQTDRGAERYATQVFDSVPPDGVLITGDYSTTFTAWWLRSLMGARPDIGVLFRGQINATWHRKRAHSAKKDLAARLTTYPDSFMATDVRWELGVKLDSLGPLRARLKPFGSTALVGGDWPSISTQARAFDFFKDTSFAGKRFTALLHVHVIEQLMAGMGPEAVLRWHLEQLERIAGLDPFVKSIGARLEVHLKGRRRMRL